MSESDEQKIPALPGVHITKPAASQSQLEPPLAAVTDPIVEPLPLMTPGQAEPNIPLLKILYQVVNHPIVGEYSVTCNYNLPQGLADKQQKELETIFVGFLTKPQFYPKFSGLSLWQRGKNWLRAKLR